ncbi:MAG: uracil-DNA glycosylase [Treponema sp.]|jgi:DNA polymerase|nr:uracil-DNA glycosylase [Treponema sp.]
MTAAEKFKVTNLLNIASDSLFRGYYSSEKNYQLEDDAPPQSLLTANCSPLLSLEQIADEIRACINCPLCETRTNAAPGEGVTEPLVMVIGEGPGRDEDEQGRPFVGRAGQLLDKMLDSIGLSRNSNCFIANVIKCRPPNNRDPYPEETSACAHFLEQQIALLKPKFILVAGRIAAQTLLKTTEPIGKLRGKFTEFETGGMTIPLLVIYHPAALLRNEDLKRPTWEDLKLLRSRLDESKGKN